MKTTIILIVLILTASWQGAFCQIDLEVVWQKKMTTTEINFAKFSADGNYIYCAVGNNIHKMDARNGEIISKFDNVDTLFIFQVDKMEISKPGNYLVSTNGNGAVAVWSTQTEKKIKQIQIGASCVNITNDEKFLLIGSGRPEYKGIIIYDLNSDKIDTTIKFNHDGINLITISHDGKYFVTGSFYQDQLTKKWHDKLILWETGTWKQVAVLEDFETGLSASGYKVIRFSNDDIFLGVVNENLKANIFDLRTLNKVKSSDNNRLIFNLAFLPDNLHLLMFYGDWNGNYELELHDFYGKIRTYYYEGDIIETFGTSDSWKIFYGGGRDTFYLFKNKPTGITDAYNSEIMVSVYVEDTRIYIKTKNVELHNAKIEISDLLGKLLYVENIEILKAYNSVTVKAILPSGIYLCKIITGNREYFQKIEIVR